MIFSNKNNKIYFFLPSFQKAGISKISINLINYFIKKKRKFLHFTLDKNIKNLRHSKYLKIFTIKKIKSTLLKLVIKMIYKKYNLYYG